MVSFSAKGLTSSLLLLSTLAAQSNALPHPAAKTTGFDPRDVTGPVETPKALPRGAAPNPAVSSTLLVPKSTVTRLAARKVKRPSTHPAVRRIRRDDTSSASTDSNDDSDSDDSSTQSTDDNSTQSTDDSNTESTDDSSTQSSDDSDSQTTDDSSSQTTDDSSSQTTDDSSQTTDDSSPQSDNDSSSSSTDDGSSQTTDDGSSQSTDDSSQTTDGDSSQTDSDEPTTTTDDMDMTTTTASYLSLFTNTVYGVVIGCTALQTVTADYSGGGFDVKSGDLACGGGVTVTDVPSITSTLYASKVAEESLVANLTVTYPSSGCDIATITYSPAQASHIFGDPTKTVDAECHCAGGELAGVNKAVSQSSLTSYCATGGPVPTGFFPIPDTNLSGITPFYGDVPDECSRGQEDQSCWDKLNITSYVNFWWRENNQTCADQKQGFGDCFMSLMGTQNPAHCSGLHNTNPCQLPNWNDYKKYQWLPQTNYYVAHSIWALTEFYNDYYTAMGDALSIASGNIGKLAKDITPNVQPKQDNTQLLTILSLGLGLIPEIGPAVDAIVGGLSTAADVASQLIPTGQEDDKPDPVWNWADTADSLSKVVNAMQQNIQNAQEANLQDAGTFLAMAGKGAFCVAPPKLDDVKQDIVMGLTTYVTAQLYNAAGVTITRALNTDVNALASNGSNLWFVPAGCGSGYDKYNTCGTFWFDKTSGTTYALTATNSDGRGNGNSFKDNMNDLFSSGITTPELLFRGAYDCVQASGQNSGGTPSIDYTKPNSDFSKVKCLSNMKVCDWGVGKDGQPTVVGNGCETGNKDGQIQVNSIANIADGFGGYDFDGCKGGDDKTNWNVPIQCIAPAIRKQNNLNAAICQQ